MTRAEARREAKSAAKIEQYAKSGFVDRAQYAPAVVNRPQRGYDSNGNPVNGPFSAQELHERAVARRDRKRAIESARMVAEGMDGPVRIELHMPPHQRRGTIARQRKYDRSYYESRRLVTGGRK